MLIFCQSLKLEIPCTEQLYLVSSKTCRMHRYLKGILGFQTFLVSLCIVLSFFIVCEGAPALKLKAAECEPTLLPGLPTTAATTSPLQQTRPGDAESVPPSPSGLGHVGTSGAVLESHLSPSVEPGGGVPGQQEGQVERVVSNQGMMCSS